VRCVGTAECEATLPAHKQARIGKLLHVCSAVRRS
jgi:hypothetical protein